MSRWNSNFYCCFALLFLALLSCDWMNGRGGGGQTQMSMANAETLSNFPPTVHRCVWATNKLRKSGDGSTITSCYGCDPAQPVCSVGCQDLIDTVYYVCDGVTMPDGYYFDPTFELTGAFIDNLDDMKINVERCGCNSASKGAAMSVLSMLLVLVVAIWMVLS